MFFDHIIETGEIGKVSAFVIFAWEFLFFIAGFIERGFDNVFMFRFKVNKREDLGADFVLEARKMLGVLFSCIDIIFLVRYLVMIKLIWR